MKPFCLLIVLLLLALPGCLPESRQQGVAALVNGRPISLRLVEVRHDVGDGLSAIAQNPSVELLQRQYGAILAELIAQELVAQELEGLGLGVAEEDVERAMNDIRNGYGDEAFSEVLSEEYLDERTWRALLRYTMAMLRFNDQVLRPKVRLAEDEVEKYYAAHAAEFLEPSRLSLLVLTGSSQKAVAEARDRVLAGRENENRHDAPDVQSQRVAIRPAALPEIWQEEMDRLAEGKATRIREANDLFQCLILEKRNPARRLTPVEAYLRIEQVLIERSMEELFAEWLEAAMAGADISVVAQLLPRGGSTDEAVPEQDADPRNSEPILGAPDEEAEDDMADAPLSPAPDGANGEGAQEKAPE